MLGKIWKVETVQLGKEMVQEGILPMHAGSEAKFFSVTGQRQWVLNETQLPPEYQEIIFHCRDDKRLEQVTQKTCALCLIGHLQKPLDLFLGS